MSVYIEHAEVQGPPQRFAEKRSFHQVTASGCGYDAANENKSWPGTERSTPSDVDHVGGQHGGEDRPEPDRGVLQVARIGNEQQVPNDVAEAKTGCKPYQTANRPWRGQSAGFIEMKHVLHIHQFFVHGKRSFGGT